MHTTTRDLLVERCLPSVFNVHHNRYRSVTGYINANSHSLTHNSVFRNLNYSEITVFSGINVIHWPIKILFYDKLNRKTWRKNPKLVNYANKLARKKLDLCNRSCSPVACWLVSRPCHPWVSGLKSGGSFGFLARVFHYKAFVSQAILDIIYTFV